MTDLAITLPGFGRPARMKLLVGGGCPSVRMSIHGEFRDLSDRGAVPVWLLDGQPLGAVGGDIVPALPASHSPASVLVTITSDATDKSEPSADVPSTLTDALARLAVALERELLFIGRGSMADEALAQAAAIRRATALVSSATRWPGEEHSGDGRVSSWARRTVVLQDAAGPELTSTFGPRLASRGYVHRGRGLYTTDAGHCAVILNHGARERASKPSMFDVALDVLLDPARPARSVFDALQEAGLVDSATLSRLPMDLRDKAAEISASLSIETSEGTSSQRSVRVIGPTPPVGRLTFQYAARVEPVNALTARTTSMVTTARHAVMPAGPRDEVEVTVMDGVGNRLGQLRPKSRPAREVGPGPGARPKVFVYGSCVTRDAFALPDAPPLVDYVARSPLGSAFSTPTSPEGMARLDDNPSAFQRRMVEVDFSKDLSSLLQKRRFDLLVLDLIDERLSMVRTGTGYVTWSPEAARCGFNPDRSARVTPGSDEHVAAFARGVDLLLDVVPAERILVNAVRWAAKTTDGTLLDGQEAIERGNAVLETLYGILAARGLVFLNYPDEVFVSDPAHKWGPAPFHYGLLLYQRTLDGIRAAHLTRRS